MFSNIGSKVKGLAIFCFFSGVIASLIIGIPLFKISTLSAVLVVVLGSVGSYLGSLALYCIGYIADQVSDNQKSIAYLSSQLRTYKKEDTSNLQTMQAIVKPSQTSDAWLCKQCGCRNSGLAIFCQACGKYK